MSKIYVGVNNLAKQVGTIYVGVNNVARKVIKAYVGVGGVAKEIYTAAPPPFQRIEYIESTGTQYINPSITNTSRKIEIDFELTNTTQGSNAVLLGGKRGATSFSATIDYTIRCDGKKYYVSGRNTETVTIFTPDTSRHTLVIDYSAKTITYDGGSAISFTRGPIVSFHALFCSLDSYTTAGTPSTTSKFASAKLYSFKVTDMTTGTVERDMKPVLLDGSNVACLYDEVSQTLFKSPTDNFVPGPVIQE